MLKVETIDILIIGGGINGAGIARDAAGRGLSVALCEKDDLAQGTSSRSGKLIHGGLRYLEYYEFRLVREALIEREVLLRAAPHIVWPMRFVLPHSPELRSAWLVRIGLFLYDHLGGRKLLPKSRQLNLATAPEGKPIKMDFKKAFEYSDCWVDDARLVVLNARDAALRGAKIITRCEVISAHREDGVWRVELRNAKGVVRHVIVKALVNAAGPWVDNVINSVAHEIQKPRIRLVKGSHIIVPKFWKGSHAYVLQHTDKRLIFVNPYQDKYALIGTTDIPVEHRPEDVAITDVEISYLLSAVNRYMKVRLSKADVKHSYAGVRPLYDDRAENPSAVTRDYVFDITGEPPLLSVFGGKITTYRKLAEHAMQKLQPYFPTMKSDWTAGPALPGGDIVDADFEAFATAFAERHGWLPAQLARHYCRLYGTQAEVLLVSAQCIDDLGQHFGGLLYEAEVDYLQSYEWAMTAQDILERRTKHGLHLSATERAALAEFLA